MDDARDLRRKIALLRGHLMRLDAGVELNAESPREAYFQTLVSRGDRRVGAILRRLSDEHREGPGAIWQGLRAIKLESAGSADIVDPDFFVTRRYAADEILPWDFIDHHIEKWFLLSERKKAHYEHQTKPCDVTRCTVCGAC
jgi:hypothetical protein